jgi:hypothetical protein
MVTARTTTAQTSHDRGHDNSNTSDRGCVCCHSYHVRDVAVTISKYVVATMPPMMGDHEGNINKDKSRP